jgi:hypothetical protein
METPILSKRKKQENEGGTQVKRALTEVKMSGISKRSELDNQMKTYQCTKKVTVLGLVCGKMSERVMILWQEVEDRRVSQETGKTIEMWRGVVEGSWRQSLTGYS